MRLYRIFAVVIILLMVSVRGEAMYAESTIRPDMFWIRKVKDSTLFLRVRWGIRKVQREDMDGESYSMYEFEEQEILHEVPFECLLSKNKEISLGKCSLETQEKIASYLEKNKAEFLSQARDIAKSDRHGGQVNRFRVKLIDGKIEN